MMEDFDDIDWVLLDFEKPKKAGAVKAAPVSQSPLKSCPKCGRELGKGGHFHVKHCKGVKDGSA